MSSHVSTPRGSRGKNSRSFYASSNLSAIKAWKGSMTTSRSNCLGLQIEKMPNLNHGAHGAIQIYLHKTVPNQQQFRAFNDQSRYWYKGESSLSTSNYVQSKKQSLDTKWTPILFSSKKNFIPQHAPLAPFAGIDHLLKIDIKKNKSATHFNQWESKLSFGESPVSRWPLLKREVPRPTFHSVLVPTCRPVARRSGRSCLYVFKKCDVFWHLFKALGMPWVASVLFCWLGHSFL